MRIKRKKIFDLNSSEMNDIKDFFNTHVSTVFHEPDFNVIVEEVFRTSFSYCLAYNDREELIAACPLHSIKEGSLTMTYSNPAIYGVPYGGWVYNKRELPLKELMKQLHLSHNEALTYWSTPQIDANDYLPIKNKQKFQTAIIDLNLSLDEILYRYISRNTRHNINRAPKKGVTIEELAPSNLNILIRLISALQSAVGLRVYPQEYYTALFQHYYPRESICAFVSKLNEEYLSGVLVIGNKHMMHAWMAGRSNEIPPNIYQNELLWWEAIKWAKMKGSRYYDLCVVKPERLPSIAQFKLGFSKETAPFYCITKRKLVHRIISRIRKCFR